MDSNYSAIPKSSNVELQLQNGPQDFRSQTKYLLSDDGNKVNHHQKISHDFVDLDDLDGGDDDDVDADLEEYSLVTSKPNSGSGISGAVFNLTTTIIGAGIMALPASMKVLGVVLGLILIVVIGILSEISVEMLIRFAVYCKARSYGEVVQIAMGRTPRVLADICIIINNAGVLVVYLIIMGDVMSGSVRHIGVFDQWLGHGFWDHRKLLVLVVVVFFLAPLCALDRIDSLSTTSAASVALAVVFVVVCFTVTFIKLVEGKIDAPKLSPDLSSEMAIWDFVVVIPVMTNAYICHFNVQPIYNELEGRSPQKMNRVGRITTSICVTVYAATALSGYLLFGKDTEDDVLTNFDKDLGIRFSSALNYIVRVGYIFHLVLVFPVIHFSLRQTVDSLVFEGSAPLTESRKRSLALTGVLLVLIYIGSTMIPNIWTAFKFTGATTAVSLGFMFPALVALKISQQEDGLRLSRVEKFFSWVMLIIAVIVSIAGLIGNIYTMQSKPE